MNSLFHIGKLATPSGIKTLYLRKVDGNFEWFDENNESMDLRASSLEETIRLANQKLSSQNFHLVRCGYVFMLPERDEHGSPANFHQMVQSLNASSGIYFDEEAGHNCIVYQIPSESRKIYELLKSKNKALNSLL